jgi:hypothetical protein
LSTSKISFLNPESEKQTEFSPPYPEAEGFYQRGFELSINLLLVEENCRNTSIGGARLILTELNDLL